MPFSGKERDIFKDSEHWGSLKTALKKYYRKPQGKNLRNSLTWPKTNQNGKFSNTDLLQLSERIIDFVVT